ncbi:MAG: rhomboid family intramembrane serine protease [Planctomycetaceae bacterium]
MIPYNTDAPLYHLPIGTALLMFANLACFAVHGPLDGLNPWILAFGNTLNPLEWLSSLFAHDGAVHLAGNMYFLAVFGVIVEGKLGWRRFVPLYLSIGLIDSGLTQLIMLPASGGGAVGASSAIMSLMAICLVWAPRNELSLAFWCLFRLLLFEVSIFAYAMFYIVWETVWLVLFQFQMSTPALHLIGIAVGLVAGALYVKKGWVDCENWDLFAVMAGTYGRFGDEATRPRRSAATPTRHCCLAKMSMSHSCRFRSLASQATCPVPNCSTLTVSSTTANSSKLPKSCFRCESGTGLSC